MNIVDLIFSRNHGQEMAVVSTEGSLSFAGLQARMLECEHGLRSDAAWPQAVKRPRIGLRAPSGADYIVLALAILKAGACFVPIPAELTACEQEELMDRTALHAVLANGWWAWPSSVGREGHEEVFLSVDEFHPFYAAWRSRQEGG